MPSYCPKWAFSCPVIALSGPFHAQLLPQVGLFMPSYCPKLAFSCIVIALSWPFHAHVKTSVWQIYKYIRIFEYFLTNIFICINIRKTLGPQIYSNIQTFDFCNSDNGNIWIYLKIFKWIYSFAVLIFCGLWGHKYIWIFVRLKKKKIFVTHWYKPESAFSCIVISLSWLFMPRYCLKWAISWVFTALFWPFHDPVQTLVGLFHA